MEAIPVDKENDAARPNDSLSQQIYLYNYAFNQDLSCVSIGTSADFRTFTISPSLAEVSRRRVNFGGKPSDEYSPVNVASMLFQTNYLGLVLRSNPYKVLLWDESLSQPPHVLWSRFEVLNVALRRDILCVVSEYKIYVYEFGGQFQVLLHLATWSNPKGLCCLSVAHPKDWTLACPGSTKGSVRVQVGLNDSISNNIAAHSNPVANLALNQSGSIVASASDLGTVIKIFSSSDGQLLYELRRGISYTQISSLVFRPDSKFIVVGSANQTVHVFKLDDQTPASAASVIASQVLSKVAEWRGSSPPDQPATIHLGTSPQSSSGQISRSTSLIPGSMVPKYFQSSRSFAQFRIPDYGGGDLVIKGSPISGPLCTFAKHAPNHVLIIHPNGLLYEVTFDESKTEITQDCTFVGATAYFQARPEFTIKSGPVMESATDEDAWNVL